MLALGRVAGSRWTRLPVYHFPPLPHVKPETTRCPFPPVFFLFSSLWLHPEAPSHQVSPGLGSLAQRLLLRKRRGDGAAAEGCWISRLWGEAERGASSAGRGVRGGRAGSERGDGARGRQRERRGVAGVMARGLWGSLEVRTLGGKGQKSVWGGGTGRGTGRRRAPVPRAGWGGGCRFPARLGPAAPGAAPLSWLLHPQKQEVMFPP